MKVQRVSNSRQLMIFCFVPGYNEQGETSTKTFKDWAARIAQHEMDHLDGKLYTDIMDRKSLECTCWEEVNLSEGKVAIPFSPE